MDLSDVKYDDSGLIPAIIQEDGTGEVLMLAYMNEAS
ncbi:MAG: bifunctional phosphoribosyl-AMP cyclohydrolase/phosphoribosyl-ATP pyrophosphatase, partial [Terriglobia bacterium]